MTKKKVKDMKAEDFRPVGRPKVAAPRNHKVTIRLSDEELSSLKSLIPSHMTQTDYFRMKVLQLDAPPEVNYHRIEIDAKAHQPSSVVDEVSSKLDELLEQEYPDLVDEEEDDDLDVDFY